MFHEEFIIGQYVFLNPLNRMTDGLTKYKNSRSIRDGSMTRPCGDSTQHTKHTQSFGLRSGEHQGAGGQFLSTPRGVPPETVTDSNLRASAFCFQFVSFRKNNTPSRRVRRVTKTPAVLAPAGGFVKRLRTHVRELARERVVVLS